MTDAQHRYDMQTDPRFDREPEPEEPMDEYIQAGHAAYIRGEPSGSNPGKTLLHKVAWAKGWERGEEEAWERLGETELVPASAMVRRVAA
jgi:hypothetical protein